MAQLRQKLTHNKAAKYSQKLISKKASLKKEKVKMLFLKDRKSIQRQCRVPPCTYEVMLSLLLVYDLINSIFVDL